MNCNRKSIKYITDDDDESVPVFYIVQVRYRVSCKSGSFSYYLPVKS